MVFVGTFHGSQEAVENGTAILHILGAVAAIFAGNGLSTVVARRASALGLPRLFTVISAGLGIAGLLSTALLAANIATGTAVIFDDGVWERGAVYALVAWQLFAATAVIIAAKRGALAVDRNRPA
ncbi:hypothetical protein [Klenkia brasiliensis]|uniref:hypothetical protein n=1 Tax=Klenkia brasiliensis TaxID=333142 RepID=UPI000B82EE68|nr:hypothetical protein [Klenkia brasiliensis]